MEYDEIQEILINQLCDEKNFSYSRGIYLEHGHGSLDEVQECSTFYSKKPWDNKRLEITLYYSYILFIIQDTTTFIDIVSIKVPLKEISKITIKDYWAFTGSNKRIVDIILNDYEHSCTWILDY